MRNSRMTSLFGELFRLFDRKKKTKVPEVLIGFNVRDMEPKKERVWVTLHTHDLGGYENEETV